MSSCSTHAAGYCPASAGVAFTDCSTIHAQRLMARPHVVDLQCTYASCIYYRSGSDSCLPAPWNRRCIGIIILEHCVVSVHRDTKCMHMVVGVGTYCAEAAGVPLEDIIMIVC